MNHFPQLTTGSVAQYPLVRERRARCALNEAADGSQVKLADSDRDEMSWLLRFSGMTDAEWQAIEELFQSCEGSLLAFTFTDPFDNLLAWSEDLTQAVWQKGPLVVVTGSMADPFGTDRASRVSNNSQTGQFVQQVLPVSASSHYCLSGWMRSDTPKTVSLRISSTSSTLSHSIVTSPTWQRFFCSGSLGAAEESVEFGIDFGAGADVEVFGLQVEAQRGASEYKKTSSRGGVYTKARFAEDTLRITSEGQNQHSLDVRIVSSR